MSQQTPGHEKTAAPQVGGGDQIILDGEWEVGVDRHYDRKARVPGLAGSPREMSPGTLWYRRRIHLPKGDWSRATLLLNGARFAPTVWVEGEKVAAAEGGMAPIALPLASPRVQPDTTITLEIALQSLRDLDPGDASAVPAADRWRADISSGLWDSVGMHFSGAVRIARVVPWTDFPQRRIDVRWTLEGKGAADAKHTLQAIVLDANGQVAARSKVVPAMENAGVLEVHLGPDVRPWTPDAPVVHRLRVVLQQANRQLDAVEFSWGLRDFRTQGVKFLFNGAPLQLRGASVVWHRWVRDPQAHTLAWDLAWFERHIVRRLKNLGANLLRFHLGLPPEAFLDLCDREGLLVQMEWSFFHGISAATESMAKQWRSWLDVGMRHPCVAFIHPWNETDAVELKSAWSALDSILPEYPPLVVAHRDAIPVHKYWWSVFENVGLYYDSVEPFGRPIMVDEFGGNYLDYDGGFGAYPAIRESFFRFVGRDSTPERRLRFQAESTARIAEYWRRLGAAGVAPFCTLGSLEDGNTWFLGTLANPQPKPVWAALAATYAPQSVSMEIWDRNLTPGQTVRVPVYFFNDGDDERTLTAEVRVVDSNGAAQGRRQTVRQAVPAHAVRTISVAVAMPPVAGEWRLEAALAGAMSPGQTPIISAWDVRTVSVTVPSVLQDILIGVPEEEIELRGLLAQNQLSMTAVDDTRARLLVFSAGSWARLQATPGMRGMLQAAVQRGQSLVLLDIGPRNLGQGYRSDGLSPLDQAPGVEVPKSETIELFSGIQVSFAEVAEPESHFHPAADNDRLWAGLPRESTWLWNGLRGGLVVPAADMEVAGLAPAALVAQWAARGAEATSLESGGDYFAYQLAGYYDYSTRRDDAEVEARLRQRVKFLVEDAPSLQGRINPGAPVQVIDLTRAYRRSRAGGLASALIPLASCGKNLLRTPVVELTFGPGHGKMILSQLLTAGRLQRGQAEPGLYGLRYDPAAEQFVLNMLAEALPATPADSRAG